METISRNSEINIRCVRDVSANCSKINYFEKDSIVTRSVIWTFGISSLLFLCKENHYLVVLAIHDGQNFLSFYLKSLSDRLT